MGCNYIDVGICYVCRINILRWRWKSAVKKSGVEYMSLYRATRSSFACQKLKEGFSYEEIGAVLGHKHIATTKRYGEIFVEQTRKVLEGR